MDNFLVGVYHEELVFKGSIIVLQLLWLIIKLDLGQSCYTAAIHIIIIVTWTCIFACYTTQKITNREMNTIKHLLANTDISKKRNQGTNISLYLCGAGPNWPKWAPEWELPILATQSLSLLFASCSDHPKLKDLEPTAGEGIPTLVPPILVILKEHIARARG